MLQNLTLNNNWFLRPIVHALPHSIVRSQCQLRAAAREQKACVHGALATTRVNVFTLTLLVPSPISARMVTRRSGSWNPTKT